MFDTGSRELIDFMQNVCKTWNNNNQNFDALNDVQNLEYSAECIKNMD